MNDTNLRTAFGKLSGGFRMRENVKVRCNGTASYIAALEDDYRAVSIAHLDHATGEVDIMTYIAYEIHGGLTYWRVIDFGTGCSHLDGVTATADTCADFMRSLGWTDFTVCPCDYTGGYEVQHFNRLQQLLNAFA